MHIGNKLKTEEDLLGLDHNWGKRKGKNN